ncbi:hypothetical protein [Consotaella aegiceratis]|uniref:hypothetical protein n=1 Tax=Consotaella aegiceratis TaxID=3097961 RepID=UPI002F3E5EE4
MAEDWSSIAAEVDAALLEIADVSQSDGHIATLRRMVSSGGGNPWEPGGGTTTTTYHELAVVEGFEEVRDATGSLIGQTRHTLTVSAAGVKPLKSDTVAVGFAAADVTADTPFAAILAVRPLAPAGVAVLYEIDLVS